MSDELLEARARVVEYLHRELIGPREAPDEVLNEEPTRRYTMGILYPRDVFADSVVAEEEEDATGADGGEGRGGLQENQSDDPITLANQYLPGSMGMSFYLVGNPAIRVRISGARYEKEIVSASIEGKGSRGKKHVSWRRVPVVEPADGTAFVLTPDRSGRSACRSVFENHAELRAIWRPGQNGWLVTVSVVNSHTSQGGASPDPAACLYQLELRCEPADGGAISIYPRPRMLTEDREEHILDLLYRRHAAYGTGHGCSVMWEQPDRGTTPAIWTEFMPRQEVKPITYSLAGFDRVLDLRFLADEAAATKDVLLSELRRFVAAYREWIEDLPTENTDIPADLTGARDTLLARLRDAAERMNAGVDLLETDAAALRAFRLANQAMLMQMIHSAPQHGGSRKPFGARSFTEPPLPREGEKIWRPFQLAFQLLTAASVVDPSDAHRDVVDLIWFPTGGGKTEAYLAVSAFLIFYRRLSYGAAAAGTTILMRYTLRLLTQQQFRRAAALICACELLRRRNPEQLGRSEISIGLWVGQGTTPNRYQQAYEEYVKLIADEDPVNIFQIEWCPWCGTELVPSRHTEDRRLYGIYSTQSDFRLYCPATDCPFHDQLPVGVVDEQLYDHPPTILLATVDKFAAGMPWDARVVEFFGGADRRPPDLIIQDELHLISGPLGTIVGVYETVIDALASWHGAPPKIIASTATIRRAEDQCLALYDRRLELFPPSGLTADDSYFARYDTSRPGRLYLGMLAPGHTSSTAMIRTSAALLQAPADLELNGPSRDAYWTLVAYHNSLRELGKVRTFAADDIPARIRVIATDQSRQRRLDDDNVQELTSNIEASRLGSMLERLERPVDTAGSLSFVLCTNMLSVGVDVQRLGLMLVNGQPKSTSEYIQATSRVGRGRVPGLVICLYSPSKPRDRSHYERFVAYHQALYRYVEPAGVTPFAQPARTRALHAVLAALVRYRAGLSANESAHLFRSSLPDLDRIVEFIVQRVSHIDPREAAATAAQLQQLVREWEDRAEESQHLEYTSSHRAKDVLLRDMNDSHAAGWQTLRSMRNVDRSCLIRILGAR